MPQSLSRHRSSRIGAAAALVIALAAAPVAAQTAPANAAPVQSSALDAPLFYQLLLGEMELRGGQAGNAYEIILDAARRTRDEGLFRRAVDIALQARAGDQALSATRAWRAALPESLEALRYQLQILGALNRTAEAAEPLRTMIALTPEAERNGLIAALPRFVARAADKRQAAQMLEDVLGPYLQREAHRAAARVSIGRAWLAAGDSDKALQLARQAQADDPKAPGPPLLAMELIPTRPAAEELLQQYLARPDAEPALRLAWARNLTGRQRYVEAATQLETVTRQAPDLAPAWLTLGALQVELRRPVEAEAALQRYLQLVGTAPSATPASPASAASAATVDEDEDEDDASSGSEPGRVQAWLLLAQAAEQRGDLKAAEAWLAKVDDPARALEVLARRAGLLARQGRVDEARELIRKAPERSPDDARAKLMAEAQVLREARRWADAYELLGGGSTRFPEDTDILYEQAMVAEKLDRMADMERLLRRVIELKPDHGHAYNALGYSLAERNLRLPEAKELIQRALELSPGDPFITDSLGWVEFRMGNNAEAIRLLRQAWSARPDAEIGAHLGEVLWAAGQQDEARRIWREVRSRDAANEVLKETLARLKVQL